MVEEATKMHRLDSEDAEKIFVALSEFKEAYIQVIGRISDSPDSAFCENDIGNRRKRLEIYVIFAEHCRLKILDFVKHCYQ